MKVLITCPPMLEQIKRFKDYFIKYNFTITSPKVTQTLTVTELIKLVPFHDGWIIGDDPATRLVFETGRKGKLKAAVKWGVGTDNIDFKACDDLGIKISNTPNLFGADVADIALGYLIGIARNTFLIDRSIREGFWIKPPGISLKNKNVSVIGLGNIGINIVKRLLAIDMNVTVYDPYAKTPDYYKDKIRRHIFPELIDRSDFIIICCSLNSSSLNLFNSSIFNKLKKGVRLINVSRGGVIDEDSLIDAIEKKIVHSAALDVFATEPLPISSKLLNYPNCIFGSHNSSNTVEASYTASIKAINLLYNFLNTK